GPAAGGHAAEGGSHHPPGQGPVLPAARAVRRRGPAPVARADRRTGEGAHGAGQDLRVPHLRGRRPRVLRGGRAGLPPGGRERRLAAHLGVVRPLPGQLGRFTVMCTYLTERIEVAGSGKGADGWFGLTEASVYFDHPVHAPAEHTLNIDFLAPGR